jgi:hypothetical protein
MSENEGGSPEYGEYGEGSSGQFEAFRARQADDRAQQETQSAYIFPPEYAADPDAMIPPTAPFGTSAGDAGRPPAAGNRLRSVAVFGAALIAACALGIGAWLAFGSSGSPSDAAAGSTATATPNAAGAGTPSAKRALAFRVAITAVGADSFTGTVPATGQLVTVTWTDKTRFGTKAHPFDKSDLAVGETVAVRGRRTGTDKVTATLVTAATAGSSGTAEPSPTVSSAA